MDLSKLLDALIQKLLLYKLKAYGFDTSVLISMQICFLIRHQRTSTSSIIFSRQQKILTGVPQSSLFSLCFSTFSSAISYFLLKLRRFVTMQMTLLCILQKKKRQYCDQQNRLRNDFVIISESLFENIIVLNPGKSYFLIRSFNKTFPGFSFKERIKRI